MLNKTKRLSKVLGAAQKSIRVMHAKITDSRPSVAYVGGWLGKRNLGDESLFEAFQRLFPQFSFLEFDGGRLINTYFRVFSPVRAAFFAGGTLIGQKHHYLQTAKSYLHMCPELLFFGTGVEDPFFWPGETRVYDWVPVLRQCRFIGVRGPLSAGMLEEHGLKNIMVVGDPVLAFAEKEINRSPVLNSIGLNIGTSDGRLWGNEERVCLEISKLASIARKAGWQVKWFVVWPKDLSITRRAAFLSDTSRDIYLIDSSPALFMEYARHLSVFVGMKLHATVLATCALTPSVMLEYRPKCMDYMSSIGQEAATFRTDTFTATDIWDVLLHWNLHREQASEELAKGVHSMQAKQRMLAESLAKQVE